MSFRFRKSVRIMPGALLMLGACASPSSPSPEYQEFLADSEERVAKAIADAKGRPGELIAEQKALHAAQASTRALELPGAVWSIHKDQSVASGQSTCSAQSGPLTAFALRMPTGDTSLWTTAITGDGLYPGSTVYLSVDGQRFAGEESIPLTPELLSALKGGTTAHISWSPWPWGTREETAVALRGFSDAFGECEAFIGR
jgi:hypothetical protein